MKIEITLKQATQFNKMLSLLKRIGQYQTLEQLRKSAKNNYGLDFEEVLEMAYENIKDDAKMGCKNIRPIKSDSLSTHSNKFPNP